MTEQSIHSVLFDFGGVFTSSPFNFVARIATQLGVDPIHLGSLIFGDYASDTDHPWHRLERGELSFVEACEDIGQLGEENGIELNLMDIFSQFPRDGGLRKEFVECAAKLKQAGYQLAIVTNNIAEFSSGWRSLFAVDEIFDQIVDSSFEGVRKPDPEIYSRALKRLNCPDPRRSVFLDDFSGNLEPAAALGMHTVLVGDNAEEALQQLERILLL